MRVLAYFVKSATKLVVEARACYFCKLTSTMGLLLAVSIGSF